MDDEFDITRIMTENDMLYTYALYASFDFEQDAMVHGLYGEMSDMPPMYTL